MTTNEPTREAIDERRINIAEAHEINYWTQRFGVSGARLADAIRAVGLSPEAVGRHLRGSSREVDGQRFRLPITGGKGGSKN
jgi:hypothetical protein